ncbi:NAD(P)H-binding protein [Natronomonas sp. CBA1123]|uniref:complex I NDUFA9 subunit family protein n=1 Tax=Natronomonas sp. CBA1123 TaxID=2668070 RepID=UPI0012E99640|nr:complex I NDUFA9 subunit family protein [Natronomonas sp. CBA1123]MUV87183.1 NAD(P)H-binding protein [Natronomonas sp. CBA1123]
MRILVVGGTGFIGENLCRELHRRGHDVTALSRSPNEADLPNGVETAMGDVAAYDSIEAAFEGQDAVINLVALSPLFRPKGGNDKHFEVHRDGTENVVRAAEEHGVGKLVQMSALGADPDGNTAYIQSKGLAEAIVKESDLDWVIFRPSVVFGDGGEFVSFTKKLAPPYLTPLPGGGKTRFQPIWVGDVVPMLADALEGVEPTDEAESDDESDEDGPTPAIRRVDDTEDGDAEGQEPHVGETYDIGGPEVLTLAEVAKLAHAADDKPVDVVPVPMALTKIGLRLADFVPGAPMGSDQYRSLQFDNTTDDNDIDAFGLTTEDLTTLADYLGVDPETLDD